MTRREVHEGTQPQGVTEQIAYHFSTAPWQVPTPTVTLVKAYDVTDGARTDVTATILSGSASVVGAVITTPIVKSLTNDKTYRVEVTFTYGGLTYVAFFVVKGEY